tara:strand:- start:788 stop:1387 length:600 start_codon:yes stop_codon:yes gene_type:complete
MSFYEKFNPLTTVAKQRFVETFTGDALDTDRWHQGTNSGSPTFRMSDSVDGGFEIFCDGTSDSGYINFDGIDQYNQTGSVIIGVAKPSTLTSMSMWLGFIQNTGAPFSLLRWHTTSYFNLETSDGTATYTDSDISLNTDEHSVKIELTSSNNKLTLDGNLKITKTTNLPNGALEPFFRIISYNTTSKTASIRYCEAYNT